MRVWKAGVLLVCLTVAASGQPGPKDSEWHTCGADLHNSRYRPLDQIHAGNFSKLEVAWRFKTDSLGTRPEYKLEGVVYSTAGSRRAAIALDAVTGELLWVHGEHEGARGLAYWTDGKEERILYSTPGYPLIALDAKTVALIPTFGKGGAVDLKLDDDQTILPDLTTGEIGIQSAPVVARDVVIVGAAFREGMTPKSMRNNKGYVRGFNVRTGKRLWIFHTIPMKGEFGADTWEKASNEYTWNTGVRTQISVDEQLGLVYLPVESPTGDYYGGHRPGNNLFGESLVCVDLATGQRKWHYQLVHHPLWDMDISSGPLLADITVNGRVVKAVAQPTKQGFLCVFDRVTGKPVWPMDERPVESKLEGPLATLTLGTASGGTNWPGGSYDPETHTVYVYACNACLTPIGLARPPKSMSDMDFVQGTAGQEVRMRLGPGENAGADSPRPAAPAAGGGGGGDGLTIQGLPLMKPPDASISAIQLDKGEILWQVAHGETPDAIRNHPALKGLTIPRTGQSGFNVTKALVIAGEGQVTTTADLPRSAMLRAYDKATGTEVGAAWMPAPQTGSPMTYMAKGKQYIIVAVSGGPYSGEYLAFTLPAEEK